MHQRASDAPFLPGRKITGPKNSQRLVLSFGHTDKQNCAFLNQRSDVLVRETTDPQTEAPAQPALRDILPHDWPQQVTHHTRIQKRHHGLIHGTSCV